jgi:hypothetical protein
MGFSEIQLLKKLEEQFNSVIVSIGFILVYLVVYGTPGVSSRCGGFVQFHNVYFQNLFSFGVQ